MDFVKMGEFLKVLRKAKGLTQEQVADELLVTQKTVSRWENGDGSPDISIIKDVAAFFDVTVDELLNGERKNDNLSQYTTKKKETKKIKLILSKYSTRLNMYLIIAFFIGWLFLFLDLMIGIFLNEIAGVILGAIGIIESAITYVVCAKNSMEEFKNSELDLNEKDNEKVIELFNKKNTLFYDLFLVEFLFGAIFYFIYLFVHHVYGVVSPIYEEHMILFLFLIGIFITIYALFRKNVKTGSIDLKNTRNKLSTILTLFISLTTLSFFISYYYEEYITSSMGNFNYLYILVGYNELACQITTPLLYLTIISTIVFGIFHITSGQLVSLVIGCVLNFFTSFNSTISFVRPTIIGIFAILVTIALSILIYILNSKMKKNDTSLEEL